MTTSLAGVRVILVGRSTGALGAVVDRLRAAGCTVQQSEHAGDALHKMKVSIDAATPFEIVIVDEGLSGIDAQLFADLVGEDERLSYSRLILLRQSTECELGRHADAGYVGQIGLSDDVASLADALEAMPASVLPQPTGVEASSSAATSDAAILLVEDNQINMEVAREMIEKTGYLCDHVVNGFEAVEATKRCRYDLVLMDCQMPGMDGYEATRRIRSWEETNSGGRRVPIVAVTAHAMKGDRERCLAAGMDDYMTKPVEAGRLAATIAKWIARDSESVES